MSRSKITINITQEISKPSRAKTPKPKVEKSNEKEQKASFGTPEKLKKEISKLQRQLSKQTLEKSSKPKAKTPKPAKVVPPPHGGLRQVPTLDVAPTGRQKMALISKILGM